MFAQAERLDRTAFTDTYTHGRKVHMPGLLLIYAQAPVRKVAVVVGKKVTKSAVARNLIRRRLYAALYEAKILAGHVIVIAKPVAKTYSYVQLEREVSMALTKAGALGVRVTSR